MGSHKNIRKYKKQYIKKIFRRNPKKIIGARKECWNVEKIPKLVEEIKKYKRLKFNSIFLTDESPGDKKNSIRERKVQNQMFMDSIKFYPRFN